MTENLMEQEIMKSNIVQSDNIKQCSRIVHSIDKATIEEVVAIIMNVGSGRVNDPVRKVKRYFTKDGLLIGEVNRF